MDPSDLRLAPDPAATGHCSLSKELGKRVALDGRLEAKLAIRPRGLSTGKLEFQDQVQSCLHPCNRKVVPQATAEGASNCHGGGIFLGLEGPLLTLGHIHNTVPSENVHSRRDLQAKPDEKGMNSGGFGLDLNAVDTSNEPQHNPFFPYKKLGQSKVSDPSECGSSTGPLEESEPLRKWREMKQNGFLSSSQRSVVIPKPRGRPKRRKQEEFRKNSYAQNEQTNKILKVGAPSGLLSGLNPGIINHVRNSKQVYSIIEAIVRSEKLESENHQVFSSHKRERRKEVSERTQEDKCGHGIVKGNFASNSTNASMGEENFHRALPSVSKFLSEDDDDSLKLQLSSAVTMASERTTSTSTDDPASNHDYITSLSLKAASVASQWLELLQQDIRGRLAALKRSRKRVRNAIHTELPYLISTEFSSNQENDPSLIHSSEAGCSEKAVPEAHVARWRSLFSQMDRALQEEGRHLESWLKQVQEMISNCDKGLKHNSSEGSLQMGELCKLKKSEISERERAVQAAAASIYSTCNFVMRSENVPCF